MSTFAPEEKIDLLLKKVLSGKAKAGTSDSTLAASETVTSYVAVPADNIWAQAASIPGTAPASTDGVVEVTNLTTGALKLTAIGASGPMPNQTNFTRGWQALDGNGDRLLDWLNKSYGTSYGIQVYIAPANWDGQDVSAAGVIFLPNNNSEANREWLFDYEAGVLYWTNESGESGELGTTANWTTVTDTYAVYIIGARYVGSKGLSDAGIQFGDLSAVDNDADLTTSAAALSYDSNTGVFTLTAADLDDYATTTALTSAINALNIGDYALQTTVDDLTTTDIAEGTNLYFTDARAQAAFTEGTGVSLTDGEIAIGQDVATTAAVEFGSVEAATFTGDLTGNADTASQVALTGLSSSTTYNFVFHEASGSGNTTLYGDFADPKMTYNVGLNAVFLNAAFNLTQALATAALTVSGASTVATLTASGAVDFDATLNVDGAATFGGNVTIEGNLVVQGNIAQYTQTQVTFDDSILTLNVPESDVLYNTLTGVVGIEVYTGSDGANIPQLVYSYGDDAWQVSDYANSTLSTILTDAVITTSQDPETGFQNGDNETAVGNVVTTTLTIDDGSAVSALHSGTNVNYTIKHNLGTQAVLCYLIKTATGGNPVTPPQPVMPNYKPVSNDTIQVTFSETEDADSYKVIVIA
jgi:hypothetical protein